MTELQLDIRDTLTFSNVKPIPVDDLLRSLRGMQRLTTTFLPVLLSRLTDAEVESAMLLVDGFERGSFKEGLICRLVFGSIENRDRFIDRLRAGHFKDAIKGVTDEVFPDMNPMTKNIALGLGFSLLILAGMNQAAKIVKSPGSAEALINGNQNTVVIVAAETFDRSPEQVRAIVDSVSKGRRRDLARNAVDAIAPARVEPGSSMTWGSGLQAVSAEAITASPVDIDIPPEEMEEDYSDVAVYLRALDLDKQASGWAATIPQLVDHRVPVTLADDVKITTVPQNFILKADVTVRYRMDRRAKQHKPIRIVIQRIISE